MGPKHNYEVVVGNVGTVCHGLNKKATLKVYAEYVQLSKGGSGRAAGEVVTMFTDGEIELEYNPPGKGQLEDELESNIHDGIAGI